MKIKTWNIYYWSKTHRPAHTEWYIRTEAWWYGTPEGLNNISPGLKPRLKNKTQTRFGGIFVRKEQKSW